MVTDNLNGPKIVAKILSKMSSATRNRLVKRIQTQDPQIAEQIEENLVTFEEIPQLTPKSLQLLAKTVDHDDLVLSLKTSDKEVQDAFYQNMSQRKVEMLQDDLETLKPAKVADIEQAQKRILETLEKLREEGKVTSINQKA